MVCTQIASSAEVAAFLRDMDKGAGAGTRTPRSAAVVAEAAVHALPKCYDHGSRSPSHGGYKDTASSGSCASLLAARAGSLAELAAHVLSVRPVGGRQLSCLIVVSASKLELSRPLQALLAPGAGNFFCAFSRCGEIPTEWDC